MPDGNEESVKVAVRQRPLEGVEEREVVVKYEAKSSNIILIDDRPYCFDHVLGPEVTQKDLFNQLIDPLVEKVKKGFNCTALAYGQTGTGKSYTMGLSSEVNDPNESGVVRRCLWKLFENIENSELRASFIEIYNEKAYDLLTPNRIIMAKGLKQNNVVKRQILTIDDCDNILKEGTQKRHVRPTIMNTQSSRSHVIFTIELLNKTNKIPTRAYLNLVDLAGSEGVRRTGHIGVAMSEGVHINQGLLCIGKMLQAMSEGQKVIPYRDSVLGSVLQDSLNSNSYLTLLACISAKRIDLSETLSTIRFAQRAKQLKRTPQMNTILMELNKTRSKTPYNTKLVSNSRHSRDPTPFKSIGLSKVQKHNGNGNHLYNTFCTPGKVRQITSQFNHTEFGLTPKEKEKAKKRLIATSTIIKPPSPKKAALPNTINSTAQQESIFEHTIESWNLNVSSSTTVETLSSTNKPMSFSPIVQKCVEKFETVLENKMLQLMESFQKVNTIGARMQVPSPNRNQTSAPFITNSRSELKTIMREILSEKEERTLNSVDSSPPRAKCKLFTTSSPVFKVPEIPTDKRTCVGTQDISNSILNQSIANREPIDLTALDESIIQHTVQHVRRSTRLSERSLNNISLANNSQLLQSNSTNQKNFHIKPSSIGGLQERRRSIRIASGLKEDILKPCSNKKTHDNKKIINDYLNNDSSAKSKSSKPYNVKKHRKAILYVLNNGSMKELQILPLIGQKTAYQLITHRTLHGKFKTLGQLEKLPIWRGNAWERFANANMLI